MEDSEVFNLAMVWTAVIMSLCCCFAVGKVTRKTTFRLTAFVPVVGFFIFVPLKLSSVHFIGLTSFFITWLGSFKLLLFAFDLGPLALQPPSLGRFLAIACLPIKIRSDESSPATNPDGDGETQIGSMYPDEDREQDPSEEVVGSRLFVKYGTKGLILALLTNLCEFHDYMHPAFVNLLHILHLYLALEMILVVAAVVAQKALAIELEPQFDDPYMATSLQDFWGRRWNLMVTSILRPAVYVPLFRLSTAVLGRVWAPVPAVLATFAVSAVMHELIFYHLGRLEPTWEITRFFILHGVCLVLEMAVKKLYFRRWQQLPPLISAILTMSFVVITVQWLFLPELLRFDANARALKEYTAAFAFMKGFLRL